MKRIIYLLIFNLSFSISYSQVRGTQLSHYLFPEFMPGVVLMKSGIKHEAMLNYNSMTEEMVFDNKGKKLALGKEKPELVDTVYISGRKFFLLNNKFVELLYNSKCDLYAEHNCSVKYPGKPAAYGGTSETTSVDTYSNIYAGGILYELKLPDGFEITPFTNYWLNKNGELNKFINMRQLMKLYDDKEDLFKDYVKNHDVKYTDQESILQLIKYLETN